MRRTLTGALAALALVATTAVVAVTPAGAQATYVVENTSDDAGTANSLPWAVEQANNDPGSTITFAAGLGPITLTATLEIFEDVTIVGNGIGQTIIQGGGSDGAILVWDDFSDITATISDLTVQGSPDGTPNVTILGGECETIDVTLERVAVTGAGHNGIEVENICSDVTVTVLDSSVTANGNDGINSDGDVQGASTSLTVQRTTVADNGDDGLDIEGTELLVTHSTVSGNGDEGIDLDGDVDATVVNSTISGNLVSGFNSNDPGVELDLLSSTVVGNGGFGLEISSPALATVTNSIVADNAEADCVAGAMVSSEGGNIDGDGTCGLDAAGDQPETDPLLGDLGANGGPTDTHLPLAGSPAIDAGLDGPCPADDQRGVSRPQDGDEDGTATCDVGAVEVEPAELPPPPPPEGPPGEGPPGTQPPGDAPRGPATPAPSARAVSAQPSFTG